MAPWWRVLFMILVLKRGATALSVPQASSAGKIAALQTLEVSTAQEAAPLIILHGLFGSARNFLGFATLLAKQLKRKRNIIMVDLRNHGRSEHMESMTYEDMAEDIAALMEAKGIERAAVVGHSMGGKVAAVLALTRPNLVESLAVLDIAPVGYCPRQSPTWAEVVAVVEACSELPVHALRTRNEASDALAVAVPNMIMRSFVLTNLEPSKSGSGLEWRINLPAIRDHMEHIAGFPIAAEAPLAYEGSAYFIAGGSSDFIRSVHIPAIQALFPQFTISKIKEAGHWIHTESPEETLRQVRLFLDR